MVYPKDSRSENIFLLGFSGSNVQRLFHLEEEEAPLKDQKIGRMEKGNDLPKQQNATQEKLTELTKRED